MIRCLSSRILDEGRSNVAQRDEALVFSARRNSIERLGDGVAQFHSFCNVGLVWGDSCEALVEHERSFITRSF